MARRMRERGRIASAWALSIFAHAGAFGLATLLVTGAFSQHPPPNALSSAKAQPPERTLELELELPSITDGSLAASSVPSAPQPVELPRGGGEDLPRLDTGARGRGGTPTAPGPAINLADRDDAMLRSRELRSRLDRSQIQRIRTAGRRASREDWRASREPMELTFLASGSVGARPERRTPAESDPAQGARSLGAPLRLGSLLGARPLPLGFGQDPRAEGSPIEGAPKPSPGQGVRDGARTDDHRDSEKLARARPMVPESTPSVPANQEGKPSDTIDSEQEVATRDQSLIHASHAGGAPGPGQGGTKSPGPPGADGSSGPGSSSHALGTGKGPSFDANPADRRRSDYIRKVVSRLAPYWADALPRWAVLDGRQALAIVTFTILPDGRVSGAVITRPSGIPEFDENCRRAVLRAAPFAPLPPELGTSFRLAHVFDMGNPAVRPRNVRSDRAHVQDPHRGR